MNWPTEEERLLWADRCRTSFWWFFQFAWGAAFNPKGSVFEEPIHRPMADWFQKHILHWMSRRGTKDAYQLRLAILVPRRVGKSVMFTKAGQLWCHLLDSELSTYTGSEKTEFATDFLGSIKAVIDGTDTFARFQWLYGDWGAQHGRTWKTEQVVHGARKNLSRTEPSFGVWGVEGGLTGKHPDILFFDDPISYEKLATHANWLETVNAHTSSLVPVVESDGAIIWLGTRYHDGDHFGTSFDKEGVSENAGMRLPHVPIREDGVWKVYFLAARDSENQPVIPTIWSEHALRDFERKDPLRYAAQVMNDPSSSDFNPLTREQVNECWVDAKDVPKNLRITLHTDTAFKSQESQARGDDSVIIEVGHSRDGSGDVYVLGCYGSNLWRVEDFANRIVMRAQEWKRRGKKFALITDELAPGGKRGTWPLVIQSWFHAAGLPCPPIMELQRGGKKKIARIIEAVSFIVDGHVKFVKDAPGMDRLVEQLVKVGTSRHDDYSDAFADAFHKDVYRPLHKLGGTTETNEYSSPHDDVLKTGTLKTEQDYIRYATQFEKEREVAREPV